MEGRIKTVLAAGEPAALWALRHHAGRVPALDVVAECLCGESAAEAIARTEPELVLVDIPDPQAGEMEALSQAIAEPEAVVVVVTDHEADPPAALEDARSETLVRPFDQERFREAIRKASDRVYRRRSGDGAAERTRPWPVSAMVDTPGATHPDRLLVRHERDIVVLPVTAIRWIESARNYVRLHTSDGAYTTRMAIGEIDSLLDPGMFARIHRTTIVNVNCIASFRHLASSAYLVTLDDGTELRMSRMYSRVVLSSYYLGGSRV